MLLIKTLTKKLLASLKVWSNILLHKTQIQNDHDIHLDELTCHGTSSRTSSVLWYIQAELEGLCVSDD